MKHSTWPNGISTLLSEKTSDNFLLACAESIEKRCSQNQLIISSGELTFKMPCEYIEITIVQERSNKLPDYLL